ncbi:MAG: hypothetical protein L6405_05330 [Actinomycetia bacterium]|nr:hypothetical protein [Actinomycetes bacterium]
MYRQKKTYYRVWDHSISGCWDGYGKKVRVIVSKEATPKRVHSKDGRSFENRVNRANWMWVTNLPCPEGDDIDDLKNTVRVCHSRWQIENQCYRRNGKYLECRSCIQTQQECNNSIFAAALYCCKYL